ncbi:hypothetical protein [Ornithinimicrobium kibberense]|uniref:hypothetical protein n=1 Tax=Ornithinimicrobium kibberense TaxID=282060 RepID=UPI003619B5AD
MPRPSPRSTEARKTSSRSPRSSIEDSSGWPVVLTIGTSQPSRLRACAASRSPAFSSSLSPLSRSASTTCTAAALRPSTRIWSNWVVSPASSALSSRRRAWSPASRVMPPRS